ncbi:hypothetical protein LZ575_09375 [Antarcticibacterium sp. 1MA-6-2]|uniref:hypothetical protein n=1 Tax=Antarcticibacterium sp. 1MA-6-2 TaxID=2908210 RepID=UPI001F184477|nr:hypothetical protein [Antarcticibacterium sp. 1MA-6-2]UJH92651.1 hypothetical protein LZ575_09375 [Antarcticibacterium sp. 1MA-6-2]
MFETHIDFLKNWFYLLILGSVIFYFIYRVLSRWYKNGKIKILLTTLSTLILTPFIYNLIILTILAFFFYEYHPTREFNKRSWSENIHDRHEMFTNLVQSDTLIGRTKNEIFNLLGEPYNPFDLEKDTSSIWNYNLGREGHGIGWKFHSMIIKFKNSKVESIKKWEAID